MTQTELVYKHRRKIESDNARAYMRKYCAAVVTNDMRGRITKPTQSLLKRMLRDPKVPREVKQHVYTWMKYRQHRGFAN